MNLFLDLIETGKIRSKEELRSLYRRFIKTYHPDSAPLTDKAVDFDDLKRDYRAAAARLDELAAAAPAPAAAFRYDAETYLDELRGLVTRGLPVSVRAVRKNKAYAASIAYVSKSMEHLYGGGYAFAELNEHIKFLNRRIPRMYYYVLQVFWSSYDCASGYLQAKAVAERHLGCIDYALREMGFERLERFLTDVIALSARVGAALRLAREAGP